MTLVFRCLTLGTDSNNNNKRRHKMKIIRQTRQEYIEENRQRLNAQAVEDSSVTLTEAQKIVIDQLICKLLKYSGERAGLNISVSMCSTLYGYDHHPKNHILVDVVTKLDTSYGYITYFYAEGVRFNGKGRKVAGKFDYHGPIRKEVRRA